MPIIRIYIRIWLPLTVGGNSWGIWESSIISIPLGFCTSWFRHTYLSHFCYKLYHRLIRVQSGEINNTYRQVVERYEKNHNAKLADKVEFAEEALKVAPPGFLYYSSVILFQGIDKGLAFRNNDNELVNPGSKLWTWDKF